LDLVRFFWFDHWAGPVDQSPCPAKHTFGGGMDADRLVETLCAHCSSLVFAILAVVVILLIIYYFPQVPENDWTFRIALIMQMAGAAGNLVDRILFEGKVTDFISIGKFAVFNIADSSITVGVIILLVGAWINERKMKQMKNITLNDAANTAIEENGVKGE
jgi:hypothetical protein